MLLIISNFDPEIAKLTIHDRDSRKEVSEIIPLTSTLAEIITTIPAEKKISLNFFKGHVTEGRRMKIA